LGWDASVCNGSVNSDNLYKVATLEDKRSNGNVFMSADMHPVVSFFLEYAVTAWTKFVLRILILALVCNGIYKWRRELRCYGFPAKRHYESRDLLQATLAGDVAQCHYLLDGIADINEPDEWGRTALHAVASLGSVYLASRYLSLGANVAALDLYDRTPLHVAAVAGHTEVCELLINFGASMDVLDVEDMTPWVAAAKFGQMAVCHRLLSLRGSDVGGLFDDCPQALMKVVTEGVKSELTETDAAKLDRISADEALGAFLAEQLEHSMDVSRSLWDALVDSDTEL